MPLDSPLAALKALIKAKENNKDPLLALEKVQRKGTYTAIANQNISKVKQSKESLITSGLQIAISLQNKEKELQDSVDWTFLSDFEKLSPDNQTQALTDTMEDVGEAIFLYEDDGATVGIAMGVAWVDDKGLHARQMKRISGSTYLVIVHEHTYECVDLRDRNDKYTNNKFDPKVDKAFLICSSCINLDENKLGHTLSHYKNSLYYEGIRPAQDLRMCEDALRRIAPESENNVSISIIPISGTPVANAVFDGNDNSEKGEKSCGEEASKAISLVFLETLLEHISKLIKEQRATNNAEKSPSNTTTTITRPISNDKKSSSPTQSNQNINDDKDFQKQLNDFFEAKQSLERAIHAMYLHGASYGDHKKGQALLILANNLSEQNKNLTFDTTTQTLSTAWTEFEKKFKGDLTTTEKDLSVYRADWKKIVGNILIALTGLGAVILAIHATVTAYRDKEKHRPLAFFQSSRTKSETLAGNVLDELENVSKNIPKKK